MGFFLLQVEKKKKKRFYLVSCLYILWWRGELVKVISPIEVVG